MARYEDLSAYEYNELREPWTSAVNIGWLERGDEAKLGHEVDPAFVEALNRIARAHRVNQMRGFALCGFCPRDESWPGLKASGQISLGSAELHLEGPDGTVYATPAMVTHYVEAHGYRPPQPFVDAVMRLDPGGSP